MSEAWEKVKLLPVPHSVGIFPADSWWYVIRALYKIIFAVVTDDRHANDILASNVTINCEKLHASFSIRVDDVRSTWSVGNPQLHLATAFCKD